MEKKFINDTMGEENNWYEQAKVQTLDTLPAFLKVLTEDYSHDSGTFCHALVAGALGTIVAMNKTPEGDIATEQKNKVLGLFVRKWGLVDGPFQITRWFGLLSDKNEVQFKRVPAAVAEQVKAKAKEILSTPGSEQLELNQKKHLEKIAEGILPWGYLNGGA